ncbi:VWA domain-containing protein [Ideonella sp. A 288]|uniref:VWA domain-containing protein n=1 Tax=Ideonella sp. A 288 TaxID=1962181 RepID=UPI00118471EF|nr:VWA domain-containing protein [Ideonella sp. A 288]
MTDGRSRTLLALALQAAALAVLALALLGTAWLDTRHRPRVLVLVDRSQSVPRAAADQAVAEVLRATQAAGGATLQQIDFAGRPSAPGSHAAGLDPLATHIEAALDAALAAHAEAPFDRVVVVSDGLENAGDAARALRAAREARMPLQWIAVGRPPPATRIAEVLAPDRAQVGQPVRLTVQLAGRLDGPLRVDATARLAGGELQSARAEADGAGRATVVFDGLRSGAAVIDVALHAPDATTPLDALPDAAVVDVAPGAAILYAQGSPGPLARSLRDGGWSLQVVPASRLDAHADGLDGYQAVVLDDVAIADAGPRFWAALVAAVRQRGLGLVVLGGERSFARGGYRGSALESVLPVLSEPAALDAPAAIVFAVDKSGSMGQGSGGVDRFALAQRAVQETARGLSDRDALGLVVFDVAPRVLIPLGPAAAGRVALDRDWPVTPNGGTTLAPALDLAIGDLERSGAARRLLVVVTDGFVDSAPLDGLRARLERTRVELIALAVGPEADVGALQRLVGAEAGVVLRVAEAAELPAVMRSGLERRRARIERGRIAATQRQPLPFAPGTLADWPPVAAHAATRAQAGAVVAVQSAQGDPLLAFHQAGLGRVVAVTSGMGAWTPAWPAWREWPRLAGGLAHWASGTPPGGALRLAVSDGPGALHIEADGPGEAAPSVTVDTPTAQGRTLPMDPAAPGRWQARLPDAGPGLYTFQSATPGGTQRQLHLRRHAAEDRTWGTSPALDAWRAAGLVAAWDPASLAVRHGARPGTGPIDRTLVALALALSLAGVLVDRWRPDLAALRAGWHRWRRRLTGLAR